MGHPPLTECKQDGCARPPIDRCNFCEVHIADSRRCVATRTAKMLDGVEIRRENVVDGVEYTEVRQRCKKTAMFGLERCYSHGGSAPSNKEKSERSKALSVMQKFVTPYQGDTDPVSAFEHEFRRTLGRINWYDDQLALLGSANDLIWGLTKIERIHATEYAGTNKTYEARVNMLEELQRWERKHLLDLEKIWLQANLDEKRLNLMKRYVELGYQKVLEALVALGLDPNDSKVRATVAAVFMEDHGAKDVLALPALDPLPVG